MASAAFSVNIESNDVELCSGACSDLTVVDRNRVGVVSYAWEGALQASATQHVCPTATTTYRVTATSTLEGGEFAQQQTASDALTVSVRDCSMPSVEDEGVLCELRHRFDLPRDRDTTKTTKPWVSQAPWFGASAIEAGPDGSAYLIGTFSEELDLGAGKIEADAPVSGFLHKLDADCAPVRTQHLRPTNAGDLLQPAAVAVDADGSVYVASGVGPLVDFNPFIPASVRWTTELLFEKFSPSGESLYRSSIPVSLGGYVGDMEVDDRGQLYVSGIAPSATNLGSGLPIGISPTAVHTFALALDAQGHYRAQRIDTGAITIELGKDGVYALSNSLGSWDALSLFFGPIVGMEMPSLSSLTPDALALSWSQDEAYEQVGYAMAAEGLREGGVALLASKDQYTSSDGSSWTIDTTLSVRRYAADGTVQRTVNVDQQHISSEDSTDIGDAGVTHDAPALDALQFQFLRESAGGALVMSANYYGDAKLGSTVLKVPVGAYLDTSGALYSTQAAMVAKVDSEDHLQWVRAQPWGDETQLGGLTPTPSGDVFVTGLARVPTSDPYASEDEWDLVVRKLRAD